MFFSLQRLMSFAVLVDFLAWGRRLLLGGFLFFVSASVGLISAGLVSASVVAEENTASSPVVDVRDKPEPIKHLENQGLEIVKSFPVGQSLVGWVVSFEGKDQLVYTTVDGDYLINGVLLDAQGMDVSEQHRRAWLPLPQWQDLEMAHYLTEPSLFRDANDQPETRSRLYVFFDPYCPFSRLAWQALQPYREAGAELRWIPVAYLKPDSRSRATALLNADDPQALLALNMENFAQPEARLEGVLTQQSRQKLQDNMDLMQSLGIHATPGWVWQNAEGELETLSGMPRLPHLIKITGLPEQKHSEPELMRFR